MRFKTLTVIIGLSLPLIGSTEFGYSYDMNKLSGGIHSAIQDALKEPFLSAYDVTSGFFGGLLPHPNYGVEILQQLNTVENQLSLIEKQIVATLHLDEAIIDILNQQDTDVNYTKIISDVSELTSSAEFDSITTMYSNLYGNENLSHVLPISDDFYDYASNLCVTSGCEPNSDAINMITSKNLNNLIENFQNSLANISMWRILNQDYITYLQNKDEIVPGLNTNYVAKYVKATSPIIKLEINYYQKLLMLYNIQALQLAFYYANPDSIKNSSNFAKKVIDIGILSSKTGKNGYEEAMQNLTKAYINTFLNGPENYVIMNNFGGKYLQIDNQGSITSNPNTVLNPILSNITSLNKYFSNTIVNNESQLFNTAANNNVFDPNGTADLMGANYTPITAFLNNCQIINADFPLDANLTTLKFICNIKNGSQQYTLFKSIDIPYTINNSGNSTYPYTFAFKNLDLFYDGTNNYYYIAPITPNFNVGTLKTVGNYDNDLTEINGFTLVNPARIYDCKGGDGSAGKCHAAYYNLRLEFKGMVLLANQNADSKTARMSCVLPDQKSNDGTTICYTQKLGYGGFINYTYNDYYAHQHNSTKSNATLYILTLSGHIFPLQITFPKVSGRNEIGGYKSNNQVGSQEVHFLCFEGYSKCDYENLIFYDSLGKTIINYDFNNLSGPYDTTISDAYATADAMLFYSTLSFQYLFTPTQAYKQWLENSDTGKYGIGTENPSYSTYALDLSFMGKTGPIKNNIVILISANGNYRLVYIAGDQQLVVQSKNGNSWIEKYNAFNYSNNNPQKVNAISFQNGNLATYYYNYNSNSYKLINSIALEYQNKGYKWIDDPYAQLVLQNDGNLVIKSSNADTIDNNKLGLGSEQILWAANWLNNAPIWSELQNPQIENFNDIKQK